MAKQPDGFTAHVLDMFAVVDGISARSMFGGWGIYREGVMFALIADEVLYMKVDDAIRPQYEEEGMQPFTYEASQKKMVMSYYELPERLWDEPHELKQWIEASYRIAVMNKKPKRPSSKGKRKRA